MCSAGARCLQCTLHAHHNAWMAVLHKKKYSSMLACVVDVMQQPLCCLYLQAMRQASALCPHIGAWVLT